MTRVGSSTQSADGYVDTSTSTDSTDGAARTGAVATNLPTGTAPSDSVEIVQGSNQPRRTSLTAPPPVPDEVESPDNPALASNAAQTMTDLANSEDLTPEGMARLALILKMAFGETETETEEERIRNRQAQEVSAEGRKEAMELAARLVEEVQNMNCIERQIFEREMADKLGISVEDSHALMEAIASGDADTASMVALGVVLSLQVGGAEGAQAASSLADSAEDYNRDHDGDSVDFLGRARRDHARDERVTEEEAKDKAAIFAALMNAASTRALKLGGEALSQDVCIQPDGSIVTNTNV